MQCTNSILLDYLIGSDKEDVLLDDGREGG
jgi:hypothetical protein